MTDFCSSILLADKIGQLYRSSDIPIMVYSICRNWNWLSD